MTKRGTSNTNERGSAAARRARRQWLIEKFRANVDVTGLGIQVLRGQGQPACRCYRCGDLLTLQTVTVDRIIPSCQGGTYRRNNIRPACGLCNSVTGVEVREQMRRGAA